MDWKEYTSLNLKGQLYYVKGNKRFQIVTDDKIYFYLVDPDTFEPVLENTIYNFMECTQMMFGTQVRFCITFKQEQKSLDIY